MKELIGMKQYQSLNEEEQLSLIQQDSFLIKYMESTIRVSEYSWKPYDGESVENKEKGVF